MLTRRACLAIPAIALAGCSPAALLNATISTRQVEIDHDVAYGEGPRRRLDVYRPRAAQGGLPMLVFFYGGRFQSGAKEDFLFVGQALGAAGFCTVVPDTRLWPATDWQGMLDDGAAAVAFSRRAALQFGGDPTRLLLAGHSSGAYVASMLALDPARRARVGALRGWIGMSGPYDFLPSDERDIAAIFAGANPASAQAIGLDLYGAPPSLLLHGLDDETVRPRNSEALAARLASAGIPVDLKLYSGVGHVDMVAALASTLRFRAPTLADLLVFADRVAPGRVPPA